MDIKNEQFIYNELPVAQYSVGNGKPLIFLHGWGSSSQVMMPLAQKLSSERTCILLDLPGFGDTPEPHKAWAIGDYADIVKHLSVKIYPEYTCGFSCAQFWRPILLKILSRLIVRIQIDKMIITGGAGLKPKRSISYHIKRLTAKLLKLPVKLVIPSKRDAVMNKLK